MGFGKCPDKIGWPLCFHRCGGEKMYIYKNTGLTAASLYSNNMFVLRSSSCACHVSVERTDNLALGHTPSALLNCITFPPRFFIFIFIILTIFFSSVHSVLSITHSTSVSPSPHGRSRPCDGYGTHTYRKNAKYYKTLSASAGKEKNTTRNFLIPDTLKTCFKSQKMSRRTHYVHNTRRSVDNNSRKHHGFPKWDLCGKKPFDHDSFYFWTYSRR